MGDNGNNKVLVIGAGLAGIEASLLLAQSEKKVYLVEKTSYIGGTAIKFEEVFSNMECSTCMVAPKQQEILASEHIELHTLSEVEEVTGNFGDFAVKVKKRARYVDMNNCIGCNACFEPCPVSLKNEFEEGLIERKAIYVPCAGALPNVPSIDTENCLRFNGDENCQACKEACMFEAIDYDQNDEQLELKVGAIVVTTGFDVFDPKNTPEFGYGKFDDVYTAFEFERLFATNGPTEGQIVLKNGDKPRSAAIIHCVGRGQKGYCSSVCCMYSFKFIHYLKTRIPDIEVFEFFSDLCIPGKSYQKFYDETREMGVTLSRASDVKVEGQDGDGKSLVVHYKKPEDQERNVEVDMVILTPAIEPRIDAANLAKILDITQDETGFFKEEHPELATVNSSKEGIFIAGCAQGPKDIQNSIAQAEAAVGKVLSKLT
jgi:heterodisulfide reductase subunit A